MGRKRGAHNSNMNKLKPEGQRHIFKKKRASANDGEGASLTPDDDGRKLGLSMRVRSK